MNYIKIFNDDILFEWDEGNIIKNVKKHNITNEESESVFFDTNKIIYKDTPHSNNEIRYIILGKSKFNKLLFTVFTERNRKIRIISTRIANKKEVNFYEEENRVTKI
ncbi:BrnT family toxin [Patescibacteria group bacterium]|nr:BrnT family toxin [Patescibacteria group bacterium]